MAARPHDWEIIGSRDPWFGVLSSSEFRADQIDEDKRKRFYETGVEDIAQVLAMFDTDFGARPSSGAALDIGCGVGRLSYALAQVMPQVAGYDVSESMLQIARTYAPANLKLSSNLPSGSFSWINSYIVFQHIPPAEGLKLLKSCLGMASPGAFASIQITGWRDGGTATRPLAGLRRKARMLLHRGKGMQVDPLIQMHDYNFSDVMKCFVEAGFDRVVLHPTYHAPHHGVWFIARKSA
ncbi:MAG TPA: class I SAM-dependent methyltransferase [Hyphomonadaceae bacterium]|nr:class I SAM-dependent methyltransferase [Hyphomonadaceae bacterium]HPN04442.1 class I SAM-dependent methyltransferase [Hyphomonadaceae bacterium]